MILTVWLRDTKGHYSDHHMGIRTEVSTERRPHYARLNMVEYDESREFTKHCNRCSTRLAPSTSLIPSDSMLGRRKGTQADEPDPRYCHTGTMKVHCAPAQ